MKSKNTNILYISNILPKRSETFVYREIFALQDLDVNVYTASIHEPELGLGSERLEKLARLTIPVYSSVINNLLLDFVLSILISPIKSFYVMLLAFFDAFSANDITGIRRLKVIFQAIAAIALAKRLRKKQIAHIHAHMAHVPTTIAMYTAFCLGITFSFTGHANDIFPNRALLDKKIKRALFISCISIWHRNFYQSIFPKSTDKLPIIRCGVDTRAYPVVERNPGIPLKIFTLGRLVSKKGFDLLINAAEMIAKRKKCQISITIGGDGEERKHLENMIASLPPEAQVSLIGEIDNERAMVLMGECDLFVLPLRISPEGDRDGIPVVLMEAMARGRCVISGDLDTIRELIRHDDTGFLIPTENVDTIVELIEYLAVNPSRIAEIGREARKKIEEEFDLNINAQRLISTMKVCGIPFQEAQCLDNI